MHKRLNKQNPPMTLPLLKPYFSPLTTNNMKVSCPITSTRIHGDANIDEYLLTCIHIDMHRYGSY